MPQRTCVACGKIRTKRELIRLVRNPDSSIEIDASGRKAGRGAYICLELECWESGLKGKRLEQALRSRITQDNRERLVKCAKDLLEGAL